MINDSSNDFSSPDVNNINIKNEISYFLFFWPWFILTITMALLGSYIYLRYTPSIYSSSAQVQITKSDATSSFLTTEVTSLFGTRVNVENDIAVITSNHILSQVVKRLNLQTTIKEVGTVMSSLVFDEKLPFKIQFKNSDKILQFNLTISNDSVLISDNASSYRVGKNNFYENNDFIISVNDSIFHSNNKYIITRTPVKQAMASLIKRISAVAVSKQGEIINLSISGTNRKRNDAVLNTLIDVLIEDRIADQRQLSEASIEFIDKRLQTLTNTIKNISEKTITYQLNNDIFDTELQTSNALSKIVEENEAAFNLKIQLEIATSLLEQLKSQEIFDILPANIGIIDLSINKLLDSYNTLVIDRNNLLVSANENSPIIIQINEQLDKLRKANLKGINRYIENLQVSLSNYQKINNKNMSLIAGFPEKGYTMRALAREFKFAEDLLVFLSQRKEEASINYVSVLPNLKVLSYGTSNNFPISPNRNAIYLGGIFLGFILPFSILYLLKTLNTKINTR